ncbi:hypothetical protein RAS1_19580 [Phycisphaerae bacterium RAS1]|nr:hypothetical protein RAS1_19580 [Phycisphaerae bacterium RAS1]
MSTRTIVRSCVFASVLAGGIVPALPAAPEDRSCNCLWGGRPLYAVRARGYPNGRPWPRNFIFPLIQACPSGAANDDDGDDARLPGPPCYFTDLWVDIEAYPWGSGMWIETIYVNHDRPPGTYFTGAVSFPSKGCPLEFTIHFPATSVVCPGWRYLTLVLEVVSRRCDGGIGGLREAREIGYFLRCIKAAQLPDVLGNGVTIVPYEPVPRVVTTVFAVANLDPELPRTVSMQLGSSQPWNILTPVEDIVIPPLTSVYVPIDVEVPAGAPLGATDDITLIASMPGRGGAAMDTLQILIGDDTIPSPSDPVPLTDLSPPGVPATSPWGAGVIAAAIGIAAVIVMKRRGVGGV